MKKLFIGLLSLFVIGLGSCTKTILDINSPNPNSASTSTPQLTTPLALENAARITQRDYLPLSMWLGYTATNGGFALDAAVNSYKLTANTMTGSWQDLYLNIANWDYVKTQAQQSNLPLYQAIAELFQAYDFSCLVDLYNNVPYTDALLKNNSFTPAYDKGSDVYDSCVVLINHALTLLNDPATALTISSSTDNKRIITFKGSLPDLTKWIRFANSLKLRLLINQSQVSDKASYIQTEVAKIDPAMLMDVGDDVTADPGYLASSGKLNPYYDLFFSAPGQSRDNYKIYHANNYALDFYSSTNDPRISYFYDEANGKYTGNDFGDETAANVSTIGAPSLDPTAPSVIMIAAEALFDQAEAIQRGWLQGDAKAVYQRAIQASFAFTGVSDPVTAAADYTSQSNVSTNWNSATDKLTLILTQKWAALNNIDLLRVYDDYRRTGIPNVPLSVYNGHLPAIPTRLIYPQEEYDLNAANVGKEGKIDPQTDKVFWDK